MSYCIRKTYVYPNGDTERWYLGDNGTFSLNPNKITWFFEEAKCKELYAKEKNWHRTKDYSLHNAYECKMAIVNK